MKRAYQTRIPQRFLTWILALAMLISLMPTVSFAAGSSAGSVVADGTYTGTSTSSFNKDGETYKVTVTLTVSNGIITNFSAVGATSSKNKGYLSMAESGIKTQLEGQTASSVNGNSLDAVSGATKSSNMIKEAVTNALANAPSASSDGGGESTTAGVLPDGTYTWNGNVSFSRDNYSISVTVTVSGGKFTSIQSALTSTPTKSNSKSEYHPNAVSGISSQITGKAASMDTINSIDTVSGATYSSKAIIAALKNAESSIPSTGGDSGDSSIVNPATATGNDLSLSKVLSHDTASDTYTITLTGKATSSGTGIYTVDGYDKKYSYSTLNTGNYYYFYNGNYYQVNGLKYYSSDKKKDYYCGYFSIGNTRYYLDKTPKPYNSETLDKEHPGDNDQDKAYESCKKDEVNKGEKLPLYTKSGSGVTYGTSCVLKDTINSTNFDYSNATVSVTPGGSYSWSSNTLLVTGYNYTGNYGMTPLTVTISGLKAKKSGTDLTSNSGNAGIYASSSASTALVSITSPKVTIEAPAAYTYQLTYHANGGSGAPAAQTQESTAASYSFTVSSTTPTRSGYTFLGWATSADSVAINYRAGDTYSLESSSPEGILYAVWEKDVEPSLNDGDYGDNTASVAGFGYQPVVRVTINNGKITEIFADADTNEDNLEFLNDALTGIKNVLIGKTATENAADILTADVVSGATRVGNALIQDIKTALSDGVDGPYTIIWKNTDSNNTALQTDSGIRYGQKSSDYSYKGSNPEKSADENYTYQFSGWDPDSMPVFVTENQTYTAQYDATAIGKYSLKYNLDGGSGTAAGGDYVKGAQVTLADAPERSGYTFNGWSDGTQNYEAGSTYTMPAKAVTMTAQWIVLPAEALSDGLYIDGTKTVQSFNYHPSVNVTVKVGKFTDLSVTAEDVGGNEFFLNTAIQAIKDYLTGKDATQTTIDGIDVKTGATLSTTALKESLTEAVSAENIIQYLNDHDVLFRAFVSAGTATPIIEDPVDSEKNFAGWDPVLEAVVSGSRDYYAQWSTDAVATISVSKESVEINAGDPLTLLVTTDGCTASVQSEDTSIASATLSGNNLRIQAKSPGETLIRLTGTPEEGYAAPAEKAIPVKVYPIAADGTYVDGTIEITESHEEYYQQTSSTYHAKVIVTVQDGKIASIDAVSDDVNWVDSQWFKEYAITRLKELVGKPASELNVRNLDAVSGATFSTGALKAGTVNALNAKNLIQWVDEGGSPVLDKAWMTTGTMPSYNGSLPTKTNYSFSRWTPEFAAVEGPAVYEAVYEENPKYTVTYDLNGGEGTISDPSTYYEGETVMVQSGIPTRSGFEFHGWSFPDGQFDDNTYQTFTMPKGGVTLKAIWEEIQDSGVYGSYETVDSLVSKYAEIFSEEDNYFDIAAFNYMLTGSATPLLVTMDIDENNNITDIHADLQDDTLKAGDFENAVNAIMEAMRVDGAEATIDNLTGIMTFLEVIENYGDASDFGYDIDYDISGYTDVLIGMINALELGPRANNTVTILDEDGNLLNTHSNIRYGTRTESVVKQPEKESDTQYTYEFDSWMTPLDTFVITDAAYTAKFRATGFSQEGKHIYIEDYTNGSATISIDPETLYTGTVAFTVSAPNAVVIAEHILDDSFEVNGQNGTYNRLYGTANEDHSYTFTLTMPDDQDVYLVAGYKGDANLDAKVTTKDTTKMNQASTGRVILTSLAQLLADVNLDQKVSTKDATRSSQAVTGRSVYDWDVI